MEIRPAHKSDFWGKSFMDDLFSYREGIETSPKDRVDIQKMFLLNDVRTSVADFIRILTGRQIRVEFRNSKNGESYYSKNKDDSVIVLSADIDTENFDAIVGLSLHEATHVVRTKMEYFNNTFSGLPTAAKWEFKKAVMDTPLYDNLLKTSVVDQNGMLRWLWRDLGHFVLNFIEDRVIDDWQYKTSPGYREYYIALYNEYFSEYKDNALIDTTAYRDPDAVDSYLWRMFTLINDDPDLDALPKLAEIAEILNLPKIGRIKNTKKSFALMIQIVNIIAANTTKLTADLDSPQKGKSSGEGAPSSGGGNPDSTVESDDSSNDSSNEEHEKKDADNSSDDKKDVDSTEKNKPKQMSSKEKRSARKSLDKKKKFLSGDFDKTKISPNEQDFLQNIKDGSVDLKDNEFKPGPAAQKTMESQRSLYGASPERVDKTLVIKKVTDSVLNNSLHSRMFQSARRGRSESDFERMWTLGLSQGKSLAKKVQIRTEDNVTRYNRLEYGKVEQRRIHALVTGAEDVFYRTHVDSYNDVLVWVSVDASGSMGPNWMKTILLMVTLAQAAKKIRGFDVVIDIRGDTHSNYERFPSVAIIFDSRTDSMPQFKSILSRVHPGSSTPEGLCIRGIVDMIPSPKQGLDTYFLNISDGLPGYYVFNGKEAIQYTKSVIDSLKKRGVGVLAYYLTSYWANKEPSDNFKTMYGAKESHSIKASDVTKIAKTINALLMTKN